MGKIDDITDIYFDNKYRFADLWNGTLFGGDQIIKPEELERADRTVTVKNKRNTVRTVADKTNYWKGKYLRVLILESQAYIDYRMVIRNMLTEAVNYNRQWKELKLEHQHKKDLTEDEFLSGISKKDRFAPVLTLVVNLSYREWDGATELYDMLELGDDDILKKYISNYKLNIFDYHKFDNYDMFHTELKNVFEFVRYSEDKVEIKKRLESDKRYRKLDEDTISFISNMSNMRVEIVGGYGDMCKAFEDYKKEGREEGRNEGQDVLADLILLLNKEGRTEDIIKIAQDKNYRKQLLAEYKLA